MLCQFSSLADVVTGIVIVVIIVIVVFILIGVYSSPFLRLITRNISLGFALCNIFLMNALYFYLGAKAPLQKYSTSIDGNVLYINFTRFFILIIQYCIIKYFFFVRQVNFGSDTDTKPDGPMALSYSLFHLKVSLRNYGFAI